MTVDQIRFRMWNSDQSVLLSEFYIPVFFHYSDHGIHNITLPPPSPASILNPDGVLVDLDYFTTEPAGVRIWTIAHTDGVNIPGVWYQGSPIHPTGASSVSTSFGVNSGDQIVNQVRCIMRNPDQTATHLDFYYPVNFYHNDRSITNIQVSPGAPAVLSHDEYLAVTFDYTTNHPGDVLIFVRPFTDGSLSPSYAASGSPLNPSGSGAGNEQFRIVVGNVEVDQIRFQMTNAD